MSQQKSVVDIQSDNNRIRITATCGLDGKTGVEMEALTAASIAALTIYDMCKAVDKGMVIEQTRLLEKAGGKSGPWVANKMVARKKGCKKRVAKDRKAGE